MFKYLSIKRLLSTCTLTSILTFKISKIKLGTIKHAQK